MGANRNKSVVKPTASEFDNPSAVADYMAEMESPFKSLVEALRESIPKAAVGITVGIKWNSVSFYCHGWFATINVRAKQGLLVVLHRGAKSSTSTHPPISDPAGLLQWLSPERAIVPFADIADFRTKQQAFLDVIRLWANQQQNGLVE